jgi:biotin carboxyl carrier protein
MKYITTINGQNFEVELLGDRKVSVNGKVYHVDFEEVSGQNLYTLLVDGKSFEAHVSEDEFTWQVLMQGALYEAEVADEREKRLREAASVSAVHSGKYTLKSPMPGLVVNLAVEVGDQVKTGDVLAILESMKMENELKSPQDGVVSEINVKVGDSVELKEALMTIVPEE